MCVPLADSDDRSLTHPSIPSSIHPHTHPPTHPPTHALSKTSLQVEPVDYPASLELDAHLDPSSTHPPTDPPNKKHSLQVEPVDYPASLELDTHSGKGGVKGSVAGYKGNVRMVWVGEGKVVSDDGKDFRGYVVSLFLSCPPHPPTRSAQSFSLLTRPPTSSSAHQSI